LGEARVGAGEFAEDEDGAASGFDTACVNAISAETGGGHIFLLRWISGIFHQIRIKPTPLK